MKKYKYILFDWDGCLAKTLDVWLDAYKSVFAEYGIYPDDRTITHNVFGDWNGPKKVGITDIVIFTQKLLTVLNNEYPKVDLYEDALLVVKKLVLAGNKLALLTSSKKTTITPVLRKYKMLKYFTIILTAEDVAKHKPDPEIIIKAIDKLFGKKGKSIIIGDSKSDLEAAKNAGIDSILFYPKHNEKFYSLASLEVYNPTYKVKNMQEILNIII